MGRSWPVNASGGVRLGAPSRGGAGGCSIMPKKKAFMHQKDGGPEGTIPAGFGRRCEAAAREDAAGAPLMPGFNVDAQAGRMRFAEA